MNIQDYWSKPPADQAKMRQDIAPAPYIGRCGGIKIIDVGKAMDGINPCTALYGYGPDGAICRDCVHCRYNPGYQAKHWKCDLRELTHGSATDHRVRWPACGKYEKRTEEYNGG